MSGRLYGALSQPYRKKMGDGKLQSTSENEVIVQKEKAHDIVYIESNMQTDKKEASQFLDIGKK